MNRCYHQWMQLTGGLEYGWCRLCGTLSGYGKIVDGPHVPQFYREQWGISESEAALIVADRPDEAIREYRMRTGFGVSDARKAVAQHRSGEDVAQAAAKKAGP